MVKKGYLGKDAPMDMAAPGGARARPTVPAASQLIKGDQAGSEAKAGVGNRASL